MSRTSSRERFSKTWTNQTELGRWHGMSAIAFGKRLVEIGLRDKTTKAPTERAISEGFAKATPLKDGTPFFMWNREKIEQALSEAGAVKVDEMSFHIEKATASVRSLLASERVAQLDDLHGCLPDFLEGCFDEVPERIKDHVRDSVLAKFRVALAERRIDV